MIKNIKDLEEPGQRLKVMWAKANNFFNNFALEYLPIRDDLVKGEYGSDWTNIDKWLLRNVGISDKSVLDVLQAFKRSYASDERERLEKLEKDRIAAKRREKEEKAAETAKRKEERELAQQAKKEERALAQLAKNNVKHDAKLSQAAFDKLSNSHRERLGLLPKPKNSKRGKATTTQVTKPKRATLGNGTELSNLAKKLVALCDKEDKQDKEWIEITLDKAKLLKQAKEKCGDNTSFSQWLTETGLKDRINDQDRAALIHFGDDLDHARTILEKTKRDSPQYIWEKEMKNDLSYVRKMPSEGQISEQYQGDSLH